MKRIAKLTGWIAVSFLGLGLIGAVAVFTTVDQTPYGQLDCFRQTSSRLQQARAASHVVLGELRAGFGRARLTPTLDAGEEEPEQGRFRAVPLAGYGGRHGRPATGVEQDVWVKAVAFAVAGRTGVVVSAEALIIPREVADLAAASIFSAKGLGRESVYFGATHTHSSLGGWGQGYVAEQFAGGFTPGVREWFARQLTAAVVLAIDDLSPASLGHGSFAAPELVRNRLLGDGALEDPEFSLLQVRQADGDSAVLGTYAAHATVLPSSNMRFSGDYPGYWANALEKTGTQLALFLAGGMGSHGPRAGAPGSEGARRMGDTLAALSAGVLTHVVLTNRIPFGVLGVETTLPPLQVRVAEGWRLRPWVTRKLLPVHPAMLLQGVRLGQTLWLSTPCDFSGELALELKETARARGAALTVTSFNGDYAGYVIPRKYYRMDDYEPRTMSFYGPQLPDYFMEVMGELAGLLVPLY